MFGPSRFVFLSEERELTVPGDWNRADWPKLWLYNLHYFDDLLADRAADRVDWHRALIARWVAENPPGHGKGWEPYPTSLRIVNWVKWASAGNALTFEALHSLAIQTRWLGRRREFHLLGNHLWVNAKALVFAGAFFDGVEAEHWCRMGMRLLRRELAEQVLPDGGHFERSPMYHAIVREDVLDLLQLGQRYPSLLEPADVELLLHAAKRMGDWLQRMTHPDGGIAFFNDASLGIAPTREALLQYAGAIGVCAEEIKPVGLQAMPDSGYVRMQAGPAVMIADVANIGPDYLPGHAHADTLSFELSLRGRRVLVNGGTSTYEAGAERLRQRGTAAHNTVVVDGCDSSEVWNSFRVARRARPLAVRWGQDGETLWLEAAHDGYRRLAGRVIHRRRWELTANSLEITDTLEGHWRSAVAFWHVHPDVAVQKKPDSLVLMEPNGFLIRFVADTGSAEVVNSHWHPSFGVSVPNLTIWSALTGPQSRIRMEWP